MKILMFTVSTGNGHNSTANRIKEKILEKNPDSEIEIVDIYKSFSSKLKSWIMENGYFFVCNHFVSGYNYFFKKGEKLKFENRDKSNTNKEVYPVMHGMYQKINSFKPDVIVCTYFLCAVALANIKRFYNIPAKTICMTLDYGISPYWECCPKGLDYMFLTGEYMLPTFLEKGYKKEQLIVSGIPVADKFSNPLPKLEARKMLGLNEDLFTLVVMKGSFFPINNKALIKEFGKINKKIQIVIINGKDEKCKKDIDKKLAKAKLPHNIINLGFTDKVVEIFSASDLVLGKAGGLSTTESINAGLPSLIVNKLPQQEIYNKEFLMKNNCALAVTKTTIAEKINYLINNPQEYEKLRESTLKLRINNTLDKFYSVISSCPTADYSNITFEKNKRIFLKNIDKKRKEAIKNKNN